MNDLIQIVLSENEIHQDQAIEFVAADNCGAIVSFVGTVRDHTKNKKVTSLLFEAYKKMAIKKMNEIADHCLENYDIHKIAIYHRTGLLNIGEKPVIIVVSSAHRAAGFDACEYAIDTLKTSVPIFKKEIFEDGEVWVSAHP